MPRIAILTGGGDCPGLNGVIRAAAKTAMFEYKAEVIGVEDGFDGLIHDRVRRLHYLDVSNILTQGGTILGTSNKANPFAYPVESPDGKVTFEDYSDRALRTFKSLHADALIVVGGDGSLTIANKLTTMGVPCVGVPKTIDNDLYGTDQTFGFDSAMVTAAEGVDKLHTTGQSHHRVMILEVMGRNAGWLALGAGIAGGGDIILIPEIPYKLDAIRGYIMSRKKAGKRFSLMVVAEGAKPVGGDVVVQRMVADASEARRLGGIGNKLRNEIEELTQIETRSTILGHLQRGGSPTPFDRLLATRFGVEAARQALSGHSNIMVGLRGTEIVPVPIEEVSGRQRLVDPKCHWVSTARAVGTCFGDGVEV